jgi:hypothetical protein
MKINICNKKKYIEQKEITLIINDLNELHILKKFLNNCINEMEKNEYLDHKHFSDYLDSKKISNNFPDIIIYRDLN